MLFTRPVLLAAFPIVVLNLIIAGCAPLGKSPIAPLLQDRRAAVFIFLAPDCPLSQNYTATLNDLRMKFQASGIEFYGVFAGRAAAEGAEDFARTYRIQFPVLPDVDFRISDFLKATATPQAFVVNGSGHTVYAGAIDNRATELGQRRMVITEHYLLDALESVVEGRQVRVERTRPVGCFIERTLPS
jgi:AhpC/TSA family